jgi:hypothetical protein
MYMFKSRIDGIKPVCRSDIPDIMDQGASYRPKDLQMLECTAENGGPLSTYTKFIVESNLCYRTEFEIWLQHLLYIGK